MSSEQQPVSIEPLTNMFVENLEDSLERVRPFFVGGIIFDEGKRATFIGDRRGQLILSHAETSDVDSSIFAALNESKRLITLTTFNNVTIRQIDLETIVFKRPASVYKHPPLSLEFNVINPESQEPEWFAVGEDDIVDIFTGEKGGIVVFSGRGLPEETGLLFERATPEGKHAFIMFMHPAAEDIELDSVMGLRQFLNQLNERFTADATLTGQMAVLEALDKSQQKGRITFAQTPVRGDIFRVQMLINARQAQATESRDFARELKRTIPEYKKGVFKRIFVRPYVDYQRRADDKIDELIVDFDRPLYSETSELERLKKERIALEKAQYNEEVESRLLTGRAKGLWRNTMSQNHRGDNKNTRNFLCTLAEMIMEGDTPEEFADIRELLEGLYGAGYGRQSISFILNFTEDPPLRFLSGENDYYYDYKRPATILRTILEDEALKKEQELQKRQKSK